MKPSVTDIISQIFHYDNTFFLKSLSKEWIKRKKSKWEIIHWWIADKAWYINYNNLMSTLTWFWSMIHLYAYSKWTWLNEIFLPENYQPYIYWLNNFFNRYKVETLLWEHLVSCDEFSWTFDWLLKLKIPWTDNYVNVLVDFKTWKYYKDFYWIENRILKKTWEPYWDEWSLKKVSVQLSMYKYAYNKSNPKYNIDHIAVIRVTKLWTFFKILDDSIKVYLDWKESTFNWLKQKKIWRI